MGSKVNNINGDNEKDQNSTVEEEEVTDRSSFCFISAIPIFLLHEIFFRLPIKGVVKCKCVCPSWNSLLSEPEFSKIYAKYSPFTTFLHCVNPDPIYQVSRLHLLQVSQNGDYYETSEILPKLRYSLFNHVLSYVGACNGFLCMRLEVRQLFEVIYVTNPIIGRDSIELPGRPLLLDNKSVVRYEFGFSPVTSKYKVLRIVFRYSSGWIVEQCEIFTVGVDSSWRHLPGLFPDYFPIVKRDCVALNGFFHWISEYEYQQRSILTFDLEEEKFGQITLPPSLSEFFESIELAVYGNQLRLVNYSVWSQISIWTMKKTSSVESWTKVIVPTYWFTGRVPTQVVPVAELRNGNMLFLSSGEYLVSCNVEQRRCSRIRLEQRPDKFGSYFMPGYSPSFSLHAEHIAESKHCILYRANAIIDY